MNSVFVIFLPAGLLSSAVDLGRFMQMVLAGGISGGRQIIKPETLAEMLRPQNIKVPLDMGIYTGLGWALDGMGNTEIKNAGPVVHHGGSLPSFNSQLLVLPETETRCCCSHQFVYPARGGQCGN